MYIKWCKVKVLAVCGKITRLYLVGLHTEEIKEVSQH